MRFLRHFAGLAYLIDRFKPWAHQRAYYVAARRALATKRISRLRVYNGSAGKFDQNNFLSLVIVVFLLLACCVPTIEGPPVSPANDDGPVAYRVALQAGVQQFQERQFKRALEHFAAAEQSQPLRPEPDYYRGEALFAMGDFDGAAKSFDRALEKSPVYFDALHRLWAARLQENPKAKATIRSEIEHVLAEKSPPAGLLYAAYRGYGYLWERDKQIPLMLRLAPSVSGTSLEPVVAANLLEDMILERDLSKKISLAECYVRYFSQQDGMFTATGVLISALDRQVDKSGTLSAYGDRYLALAPENRHLNYRLAAWFIKRDQDLDRAIGLLQRNLELMEGVKRPMERDGANPSEGEVARHRDKAAYLYLLGLANFKKGRLDAAERYLKHSRDLDDHKEKTYYYLARVAIQQGRTRDAIEALKKSLEIADTVEDADVLLQRLLQETTQHQEAAHLYFAHLTDSVTFSDVTAQAGLASVRAQRVAWGDYNNDGFDDLLLDGTQLFRNTGRGRFERVVTSLAAVEGANGGVWGDYNNDGFLDIFVTSPRGSRLFQGDGKGGFVDVTASALPPLAPVRAEAAAWGDIDNDGFLDIYVANYESGGVQRAICAHDYLLHNLGNGRFEEISARAGTRADSGHCGRGVVWADFNNDGRLDILVSNYRLDPNFLWVNNGDGTFSDLARDKGVRGNNVDGYYGHTIGSVFGDIDNDGLLDLFSSNLAHPRHIRFSDRSMLLINSGPPTYRYDDRFASSGIGFHETSADPGFADVDNDGYLDLYVTSVYRGFSSHLYRNDGNHHFTDISWIAGARVQNSWGSAFADYDNDGNVDLFVASSDGVHLLRNNGSGNHWLGVKVLDQNCNRFGVGARVSLRYGGGTQIREIAAGKGTGNQDSLTSVFGLGKHSGPVDLEIRNLCGQVTRRTIPEVDQTVTLHP
jgi:tetratricopeptide (TPR) repeat protein